MLKHHQIKAIYELAKHEAQRTHGHNDQETIDWATDQYLECAILTMMWLIAEEQFSSETVH